MAKVMSKYRSLIMILAMIFGIVAHKPLSYIDDLSSSMLAPSLISAMLFITFCSVELRDLSFKKMHLLLLVIQVAGTVGVYYLLLPFGVTLAQGGMICVLTPIAMGAAAIGALLGANVARIAAFTLLCNLVVAAVAPFFLSLWGNGECSFIQIFWRVFPLLVLPLLASQLLRLICRPAAQWIASHGSYSFFFWLGSMALTLGQVSSYIVENLDQISPSLALSLAFVAALACVGQFALGRYLGARVGDPVSYGQSLGQKNTVLAVWMAQLFLSPIAALAPTAYIIWQNLANSFQIYLYDRRNRQ